MDERTAEELCKTIISASLTESGRRALENSHRSARAHREAWIEFARNAISAPKEFALVFYERLTDPSSFEPFAETRPTLLALARAGVRVSVASNTGWDVRHAFARAGLYELVHEFVLSCEHGAVKPDAEFFEIACRSSKALPTRTLMVGSDARTSGRALDHGIATYLLPALSIDPNRRSLAGVLTLTNAAACAPWPAPKGPRAISLRL